MNCHTEMQTGMYLRKESERESLEEAIDNEIQCLIDDILSDENQFRSFLYFNEDKVKQLVQSILKLSKHDRALKTELEHLLWSWASSKAREHIQCIRQSNKFI